MSDPQRLLVGGGTDFERQVLGAWETKQASDEARTRVLALVGLGVAAGLATANTAAAAGAASAGGSAAGSAGIGASLAPKAAVVSTALFKWLAISAVGVTVAAGGVAYSLQRSVPDIARPVAALQVAPAGEPTPVASQPASPAAPVPEAAPEAVPANAAAVRPAAATQAARAPRAQAASTLDEEVASLDRARKAVTAGDGAAALALVDGYDARYPNGSLAQESEEIRVEALLRQGDRAAAERRATRFLAAHPSSPYVHRIRGLLGR
jgi:hypothetical protein